MKPKSATRCHHVSTAGVQCDSPAVNKARYCYYHMQGRSTAIKYYSEAPFTAIEEDLPLFEDARSLQIAIRQIASLIIQQKIEHKAAGLLLYSIQLAQLNLKQFKAEKPHPAHVVVEAESVQETLPASAFLEPAPPDADSEPSRNKSERNRSERKRGKESELSDEELQDQLDYLLHLGRHLDDPADGAPTEESVMRTARGIRNGDYGDVAAMMKKFPQEILPEAIQEAKALRRKKESEQESQQESQSENENESQTKARPRIPPGSIHASAIRRPNFERRAERRNVN